MRRILAIPFAILGLALTLGLLIPIRFLRALPHRLERSTVRLYYNAAVVPARLILGEDVWKSADFIDLGIAPPKGHPWHKQMLTIVGYEPDGTPIVKPLTNHGTFAVVGGSDDDDPEPPRAA